MSLQGPSASWQDPGDRLGGFLGGWRGYVFAALATSATLGLRLAWNMAFGQRPLMILFMLPIIFSAFLGGMGPGLLATGLSALLLDYFLVPPTHTLAIASPFDLAQLAIMVASGALVSVLAGALLRSRAKEAAATAELQAALEEDMAAHRALGVSENSRQVLDALYRGLMETTPAGCFVTDGDWRIILVNQAYVQRSGYAREELLAMRVPDLAADEPDEPYRRILAEGQVRFEAHHRTRSGDVWPVEVVASYSPMEGGRCFVFCQDITERVDALETVRSMEAFNRAILDSVNAQLVVLDPRGAILAVNAPWRSYGSVNGAVHGAEVGDSYLAACRKGAQEGAPGAGEALEGIQAVLEARLPRFSLEYPCDCPGEKRWFTMNVTPLGDSGGGVVIAHTDNTERKRMEMALVESEKRFQDIASASSDWFWEMDREGRYTYASESVAKVLG
ncbi:MAG: PAS domain S-box protein, partial [Holophaga sp.]|nr:PAS domain S-box protein [Holophaga sp.]